MRHLLAWGQSVRSHLHLNRYVGEKRPPNWQVGCGDLLGNEEIFPVLLWTKICTHLWSYAADENSPTVKFTNTFRNKNAALCSIYVRFSLWYCVSENWEHKNVDFCHVFHHRKLLCYVFSKSSNRDNADYTEGDWSWNQQGWYKLHDLCIKLQTEKTFIDPELLSKF
jgi:hypothetical protein